MIAKQIWLLSLVLAGQGAVATVLIGKAGAKALAGKGPVYWDTTQFSHKGNKLTPKKDHTIRVGFLYPDNCDRIEITWRAIDGLAVSKAPPFRGTCEELTALKAVFSMDLSIPYSTRGYLVADVVVVTGAKRRGTSLPLAFEATDYQYKPKPFTVDKFGNRFQDEKIN